MKIKNIVIFLTLLLPPFCWSGPLIEVISDSSIELQGIQAASRWAKTHSGKVTIFNLDSPAHLERQLSHGMDGLSEAQAERLLQGRLDALSVEEKRKLAEDSYLGAVLVTRFQIDRYPAIILNRKHVIFGETDVNRAINIALDSGVLP